MEGDIQEIIDALADADLKERVEGMLKEVGS